MSRGSPAKPATATRPNYAGHRSELRAATLAASFPSTRRLRKVVVGALFAGGGLVVSMNPAAADHLTNEETGTASDDVIEGTDDDDHIEGLDGDDQLSGLGGDDQIEGGDGNDTLNGGRGDDFLDGDTGNDVIDAGEGDDEVFGGVGDDDLIGRGGHDSLDGGGDDDRLLGGAGDDTLLGGAGDDTLDSGADDDTLDGGDGSDLYFAGDGNDVIVDSGLDDADRDEAFAGDGNDIVLAGPGGDGARGGAGDDIVVGGTVYDDELGVSVGESPDLGDVLTGGDGADVVIGDHVQYSNDGETESLAQNVTLRPAADGSYGGYEIDGDRVVLEHPDLGGDDRVIGGDGADHLLGAGGNDVVCGDAADVQVEGNGGTDIPCLEDLYEFTADAGSSAVSEAAPVARELDDEADETSPYEIFVTADPIFGTVVITDPATGAFTYTADPELLADYAGDGVPTDEFVLAVRRLIAAGEYIEGGAGTVRIFLPAAEPVQAVRATEAVPAPTAPTLPETGASHGLLAAVGALLMAAGHAATRLSRGMARSVGLNG